MSVVKFLAIGCLLSDIGPVAVDDGDGAGQILQF